jgi:hypothetical protein
MVSGPEPPRWAEGSWRYGDEALFASMSVKGPEVAQWLQGGPVTLGDVAVELPAAGENVSWERVPSRRPRTYAALEWPNIEYTLNQGALTRAGAVGPLIGTDAPSFYQFASAAAWFFGVERTGRDLNQGAWVLRRQVTRGRILKVRWRPIEVEVEFEGQEGDVVEVASDRPEPRMVEVAKADGCQTASFSLPNGMPPNSWVLLRQGVDWLDQRFVNWGYGTQDADVEQVLEPQEELQRLVSPGEGPTIEFKEEVPSDRGGRKKVCKTLAAFANGDGGHLLFGVDDEGQVVGLSDEQITPEAQDTVTHWIRNTVVPPIDFKLLPLPDENGKWVLCVKVEKGTSPPYGIEVGDPHYYVRRGASTFPASTDELRHLAKQGGEGAPVYRPW